MDAEAYRADSRDHWERGAAAWAAVSAEQQRDAAPVSAWMLDAAALRPGMTVLEVAAGTGDLGLEAARRVAPGGRAIITDGAEAMVAVAQARAAEQGVENVEIRAMEAEWLDVPAASVDALLSRWGLMLLADPEAALREARRVLRPGGRVALAVWDAAGRNPWLTRAQALFAERGLLPEPVAGTPGPFALADRERLEDLLWGAGLTGVEVGAVDLAQRAPTLDAWWHRLLLSSQRSGEAVAGLAPAEHHALRDAFDAAYADFVRPDGAVVIPGRALVARAEG